MSFAWQYYAITLLVYFGANCIAAWGLNFQYGVAGIVSFGFIIFQSAGAYTAAVTTLGPSSESGFQTYDFGVRLPWPIAVLLAGVVGALLAAGVGAIALRLANRVYQGLIMLVVVILAGIVVTAAPSFLNGGAGIAAVPMPLQSALKLSLVNWGWFYVGVTAVITLIVFFVLYKLTGAPWGRKLRAIRDNPVASEAIGVNVYRESLIAFTVGGAVGAISGAILVGFIGAWAPAGWTYGETLLYLTSIIVGGTGNMYGVALGVAIIWTAVQEGVRYLPNVGSSTVTDALEYVVIGIVTLLFLRLRPQGVIPERKRRFRGSRGDAPGQEDRLGPTVPLPHVAERGASK